MRRAVLAGWIAVASSACGSSGDPVARSIATTVERELGVKPRAIRCARPACQVELPGAVTLAVRVDGDHTVTWESDDVIDPRALVDRIAGELAALGVPQAVDCGGLRAAPATAVTIECRLGDGGAAWATVAPDGAVDLELALTAAIAEARRTGPGDAALEAASRALDSDEAQGLAGEPSADTDEAAEVDAGLAPPVRGPGG